MPRHATKIEVGVDIPMPQPKYIARLVKRITFDPSGCWLWTGPLDEQGYGQMSVNRVARWVHRLAVVIFKGDSIAGREVNHTCRCRHCVNPDHLEVVSSSYNRSDTIRNKSGVIVDAPF